MPMNLALIISGDAAGAKAATGEARQGVRDLGNEARQAQANIQAANDQATASARRAIDALTSQTAAERNLRSAIDQRLGVSGNVARIGDPFAQSVGRAADVAAYGQELDRLRARYNPLFATIQQYRTFQAEIRADYARGVISSEEYAAALGRERQATLANIAALKGRQSAMSGISAGASRAAGFSAGQQVQDVAVMSAMGMPISSIAFGQGPQLATAIQQGGGWGVLKEGLMSLLQPTTLITVGLTAAAAAAIKLGMSLGGANPEAEEFSKWLEQIGTDATTTADFLARVNAEIAKMPTNIDVTKFTRGGAAYLAQQKAQLSNPLAVAAGVEGNLDDPKFVETYNLIDKVIGQLKNEDFSSLEALYRDLDAIVATRPDLQKFAETWLTIGENIVKAREALDRADLQAHGMGAYQPRNGQAMTDYLAGNVDKLRQMQIDRDVALQQFYAQSPAEKAAAARSAEKAKPFDASESPEAKKYREDTAATVAYAQAQKALDDAQKARARSLDQTIASARLDLALMNQTTAATEAARMQFQLESQIREEAARNNVEVDQAELERVERLSAAYGELMAAKQAAEAIKSQIDNLTNLRLEALLVGQSETAQARAKAQLEAELQIRKLGIDVYGEEAEMMRRNAAESADLTSALKKQADAWQTISDTAQSGIDRLVDSAANGFKDIDDALEEIGKDLVKTSLQLSVGNPLKNWLTGSDLPELGDVKNMGGALGRLFGRSGADPAAAVSSVLSGHSTAMMSVQAAVVNINGGSLGGALSGNVSRLLTGANDNGDIAGYIQQAAAARGIDPAVALKVARSEGLASGVWQSNVVKDGLREPSYGPYQLLVGGKGTGFPTGLGNQFMASTGLNPADPSTVKAQIDFALNHAAQNGWGSWYGAKAVGVGNWDGLQGASTKAVGSLNQLGETSTRTAQDLSGGLGNLANALKQFPAAPGGGGGAFSSLLGLSSSFSGSAAYSWLSANPGGYIGLYADGGWTGPGSKHQPKGVVHANEVVWSSTDVARAGGVAVVEAMRLGRRGYADGGAVVEGGFPILARSGGSGRSGGGGGELPGTEINIYPQAGVQTKQRKRKNSRGGDVTDIFVSAMKQSIADGDLDSTLGGRFGVKPTKARRGSL